MILLGLLLRQRFPKTRPEIYHLWIAGLFMSAIPFSLFSYAQQATTSILAAIIGAATPMFTLLAILVIYKTEKITSNILLGLSIGLVGVVTTLGVWQGLGENDPLAIGALLLAAVSYGIGTPYIRKHVTPMNLPGVTTAAIQVFTSAITLLPLYLLTGPLFIAEPRLDTAGALLALGILGSGFAYSLFHGVIARAGSSTASLVTYTNPVLAAVWGVLLLSEELHWYEPVGGAIVIFGVWLAQRSSGKRKALHTTSDLKPKDS